ncbi:ATP synthase F0 subunit A [Flavobacterium cyanobacteriorum]|uniref:ATP synthase subunit a n=1 Tax=Flavobacterium cyanobacteriorum TaxID=2022802 RepID=A0A255YVL4_9FLAO|nr:F0F1 ATP synthase subunit A [Flavobacterium cyanobacteriorum]OYQ33286.1 ATP synthase F0 subunit A [Flavobacterium cyanobacteriorum]
MVISNKPLKFIMAALVACIPFSNFANTPQDSILADVKPADVESVSVHTDAEGPALDIKTKSKQHILHHVRDSHDFTFFSDEAAGKHYGFPLPVILWDNGLHVFMSSEFHHGEKAAESNGNYYVLNHHDNKIYKVDGPEGKLNYEHGHEHPTNAKPLDLSITKSVLMILVTAILMLVIFTGLARTYPKNGGIASGFGRFFEPFVVYIRDEIAIPNIGEKHYKRYMSYLLTIFFFIWFLNIFGLTPLGVNVTGNFTVTAALAILTYVITTFTANKNYWGHIFWMPGVPWPMRIILAPIELLGTIIKPFSLMIRLYANIFAGHIVLMSIIALMFIFKNWIGSTLSFGLAFVLSILEILVALLQAYIFTMLSALYFGAAVEEHHHEEHHAEAHH